MKISLTDRRLIAITGEDKLDFLQGLITNDINKLTEENSLFSCLLTPQGKFFADFFIYKNAERIIIDINWVFIEAFLKKLKMYKLRSDVHISEISGEVSLDIDSPSDLNDHSFSYPDPRSADFGNRVIVEPKPLVNPEQQKLQPEQPKRYPEQQKCHPELDSGSPTTPPNLSTYHQRRIEHKMIDGAYDLIQDKSFILEYGYNELGAIDFEKGCYVGQEVTTRTFRRGVIRKAIYRFSLKEGNAEIAKDDEVILDGSKIGKVSFYNDESKQGLALIKKEKIAELKDAQALIGGNRVVVTCQQ